MASPALVLSAAVPFPARPFSRFLPARLPRSPASVSAWHSNIASPSVLTSPTSPDTHDSFLSGEWPENMSLLNYEDLCKFFEPSIFKEEAQPHTLLAEVMSKLMYVARSDQLLEEVDHFFLTISGLPVVNKDLRCIGVLSKKDRSKASKGLQSTVGEVMTSPPITLSVDKTVNDAAILMLKNKVHRIPIVNEVNQVVGIVTRTDIFKALENDA